MNTACPSCGAIYAVATKDIGRKIKCKKCGTALKVDDTGLVLDTPTGGAAPIPATTPAADALVAGDEGDRSAKKKSRRDRDDSGPRGPGFGDFIQKIGGIPTVLFGFGIFFTLYFFFQPQMSTASLSRADGGVERITHERDFKLRKVSYEEQKYRDDIEAKLINPSPEDRDKKREEFEKKKKEINRDYQPKIDDASDNRTDASISGKRWAPFDTFGLMLGFLLLSFGCIGYIRADTHLLVRIIGGLILVGMMMAIFGKFAGCRGLGG